MEDKTNETEKLHQHMWWVLVIMKGKT